MTVCIAAICEDGKAIVVAADRMFTMPAISVEFQTEEQKIERVANNCLALSAGATPLATEVLDHVRIKLNNNQSPRILDVAEMVRAEYAAIRAQKADETIVVPTLGIDFIGLRARGISLPDYLSKQGGMYQQLSMMCSQFNPGVDIIVAGIDGLGATICQVANPGTLHKLEKLGYATVGSGAIHATTKLSLGAQTRHRSLHETLYGVYEAKKASEAAPGVGDATDLAIIHADRGILPCIQSVVDKLDEIYREAVGRQPVKLDSLKELCDEQPKA